MKIEHVTVYRDAGRYAGWPANYGIWNWGDEIVVGFTSGYPSKTGGFHARDRSRPFENMQARSLDGGWQWAVSDFPGRTPGGRGLSADEHMQPGMYVGEALQDDPPATPPGDIDFTHPDFALMCARTGLQAGARSFFYISYDRCHHWIGPYDLPVWGQVGIQTRTDYVVEAQDACLLFITANKASGPEGHVLCVRTTDGGRTFKLLSHVGEEPTTPDGFIVMPSSLRLTDGRLLSAVRCREGNRQAQQDENWIDIYVSDDNGITWKFWNQPVRFQDRGHNGNPPTLNQLPDGRLVLIYGNRDAPYTIAARISADAGATWSDEITLRAGGGNHDIGYPRTVVRPDGTVVTVYYFNEDPEGERYIEAAIWKP